METVTEENNIENQSLTSIALTREISGFWRRILSFIIDAVIISLVGFAIGMVFFDALASLGGWGRLLGFVVALIYYGLLNSSLGKGQTIGKRIARLEVVNKQGENISCRVRGL